MRLLTALCVLALLAIACNLGAAPTVQPVGTLNLTSIAQTMLPSLGGGDATGDATTINGSGFNGSAGANGTATTPSVFSGQAPATLAANCTPRTDWPTTVVTQGDTLSGIALRTYTSVDALVTANCLTSADAITEGQMLRVPVQPVEPTAAGNTTGASSVLPANCAANWFFSFTRTAVDNNCPGQVTTVEAVGQNFQGGRVYRYSGATGSAERGTIYIIYNNGTWQTFVDTWDASQPNDDPGIVPDVTWYKPFGAIGKVWRDNPQLRQALGWAYQPESPFTGRIQSPVNSTGYFYIDHGLRNLVLRLYTGNNGPNRWEVVGSY
jgi:LysM repeat protein